MVDVATFGDPAPRYVPGRWPWTADDHDHATEPPTPAQMEQAGHETLMRIRRLATHGDRS